MKKAYITLSPVEHDNERFEAGASIDLDDSQAEPLLKVGAIAGVDANARPAAIIAAIGQLDKDNPDLWLKDGKPDTNAIAEITGWSVSAAERNAAWASLQG